MVVQYLVILTIPARLYGCLNVSDTLHSDSVLVVSVDVLIFELTNFVDEHTKFVGDVRNILISGFAPEG